MNAIYSPLPPVALFGAISAYSLMIVRFVKNPPAAPADTLVCVRHDASEWRCELPRAGVLPALAARFVVESTLGWSDGWFGSLATAGYPDENIIHARQSETLARLLQAEQWGGASPPDIFRQKLADACETSGMPAPRLTDNQLATLRTGLRAFGAKWRPLNAGQEHTAKW